MLSTYQVFPCLFCVQCPVLFCVFHSLSLSCFTEPFLVSVSYFSLSLFMLPCCLVPDLLPCILDYPFAFHLDSCLDRCLCTWITPLVKPSGYCSPIEDHARLLEYSSTLPSIYLFASCSTLPVFLTIPINKSMHMDLHASRLIRPVTPLSEPDLIYISLLIIFCIIEYVKNRTLNP